MRDFSVVGYVAEFPYINLELKNNEPKRYEIALLVCHIEELKKGMKVSKIYKTTKKGTSIKYEAIKNKTEALEYKDKIQNMVDEYNNRYSN